MNDITTSVNNKFIQLHLLTSYPPANLNRDDLGRPKTAKMGGVDRLRVSSQSLKRAWRTSDLMQSALGGHLGIRTKKIGVEVYQALIKGGINDKKAANWAEMIAKVFGAPKKDNKQEIEQLAHISPDERQLVTALTQTLISENREPQKEELALLRQQTGAVDIALFGRMLASSPEFNVEAACQVAHAISVHPVVIEDDYFTAVDDLNADNDDTGAGHIGESGFAAGLFYLYVCIDRDQLMANLNDDQALTERTIKALIETATKVGPTGKQNSFASRAYATYILGEAGDQQPRSLSVSFLRPITDHNQAESAINALNAHRKQQQKVYGDCANVSAVMNTLPDADTISFDEFCATLCEQ